MSDRPALHYVLVIASARIFRTTPLPARGLLTVGRSRRSDIRLGDKRVSAHHAVLEVGQRFTITDLASRNGTRLQDRAIPPLQATEIRPGEALRIGDTFLLIESGLDHDHLAQSSLSLLRQLANQGPSVATGDSDYGLL
jgi:pSer/pThr/pTyr-binding forkhead associated (FHA) protein